MLTRILSMRRQSRGVRGRFERLEPRYVLEAIPVLHSLPGAYAVLYLDFDGHNEGEWSDIQSAQVDMFGGTPAEMQEIWARVAEDFAPFNIDVTTADPANFLNHYGLRVAIGPRRGGFLGVTFDGVAKLGSFINNESNIVWAFED